MSGFVTNEPGTETAAAADTRADLTQPRIEADMDSAGVPIAITVLASRADYPEPLSHDYALKFESITRGGPPGFEPSEGEKKKVII